MSEPRVPRLTRSNVRIAQDVGLKLQIVQTMFHHVADADYPSELAVMDNRHVAHAVPGHQVHRVRDSFGRGYADRAMSHDQASMWQSRRSGKCDDDLIRDPATQAKLQMNDRFCETVSGKMFIRS